MQVEELSPKERILRLADVKARTGLSRSTIYLNIRKGIFPHHINLGSRCVGWLESEIDAWIISRTQKSRAQAENMRECTCPS
ncbi:MAG: AlpA family transcriptional regulator [Alphaproteobacteria bacterium]|nr:AlpA family transcriptional regulator [Alphaproteobacteria bacterium]